MEDYEAVMTRASAIARCGFECIPVDAMLVELKRTEDGARRLSLFTREHPVVPPRSIRTDVVLRDDSVVESWPAAEALAFGYKRRGSYFVAPPLPARGTR